MEELEKKVRFRDVVPITKMFLVSTLGIGTLLGGVYTASLIDIAQTIKQKAHGDPRIGYAAAKAGIEALDADVQKGYLRVTIPYTELAPKAILRSYMRNYAKQIGSVEQAEAYAKEHPLHADLITSDGF